MLSSGKFIIDFGFQLSFESTSTSSFDHSTYSQTQTSTGTNSETSSSSSASSAKSASSEVLFSDLKKEWDALCHDYIGFLGNREALALMQKDKSRSSEAAFEQWKKVSEETEFTAAQYNLAVCYENGYGVKKNIHKVITSEILLCHSSSEII